MSSSPSACDSVIQATTLKQLARARLKDARVLLRAGRYDAARYISGYAIELMLKQRICRALRWEEGFPETNSEFSKYQSFRTHELEVLLRLSGQESRIRAGYMAEWTLVSDWGPGLRYVPVGTATEVKTRKMIDAVQVLVRTL